MYTLFNILHYDKYRIYVYFQQKRSGNRRTNYLAINIQNQNNANFKKDERRTIKKA